MASALLRVTLALGLVMLCAPALAQESSLKPGINDNFADPDVAAWVKRFETESREIFRYREGIVKALELKPGLDVGDVGAGTGLFSSMMAGEIGPEGTVYAVDIAQNFLDHIQATAREQGIPNITTVLADPRESKLEAASVDLIFVCDTYHHFEYPFDTLASLHRALRPGGTLVIVDFERVKGISSEWALGHVRCGKGTVTDEVKDAGFEFIAEVPLMEEQYLLKFKKRDAGNG